MAPPVDRLRPAGAQEQEQAPAPRGAAAARPPPLGRTVSVAAAAPSAPLASCSEVARHILRLRADALEDRCILDSACGLFWSGFADVSPF
jgi:hypothetical protein